MNSDTYLNDSGMFNKEFGADMEHLIKIERMTAAADNFVYLLYTYRSVSKAVGQISTETPTNASQAQLDQIKTQKEEANSAICDVMTAEIKKLKDVFTFVDSFVVAIAECVTVSLIRINCTLFNFAYFLIVFSIKSGYRYQNSLRRLIQCSSCSHRLDG